MGLFVGTDLLQVGVEGVLATSSHEILMGVVLQALLIKGSLKMFEGQGIVEDIR